MSALSPEYVPGIAAGYDAGERRARSARKGLKAEMIVTPCPDDPAPMPRERNHASSARVMAR